MVLRLPSSYHLEQGNPELPLPSAQYHWLSPDLEFVPQAMHLCSISVLSLKQTLESLEMCVRMQASFLPKILVSGPEDMSLREILDI